MSERRLIDASISSEPIPVGVFVGWVKPTKSLGSQEIGGLHPPYGERL
jgi:hypothetical protein